MQGFEPCGRKIGLINVGFKIQFFFLCSHVGPMEREGGSRHAEILGSKMLQPIDVSFIIFFLYVFFFFFLLKLNDKENKMS